MATYICKDFTKPDDFSDVELVIEGTTLYVHRQYLAEWSPVWRQIFMSNQFNGEKIISMHLPGKRLQQFIELLNCIYSSQKPISDANVDFLLEMAEEYRMEHIKKKCEDFLISKDKSLDLLVLAEKYHLKKLHKQCIEFVKMKNVEEIERNPQSKNLAMKTLIQIYKAKINMLKDYANDMKNRESRLGRDYDRTVAQRDRMRTNLQKIRKIWETPNKRCFRHMTEEKFDFRCLDCNEKIYFEIRQLCSESQLVKRCHTINGVKN